MASFLKFELEDGTLVYIEASETQKSSGGLLPPSHSENTSGQPNLSFETNFGAIQKMAATIMKNLHDGFEVEPDEVNISFGVKASTEISNLTISRNGADSNFDISLRWKKEKKES